MTVGQRRRNAGGVDWGTTYTLGQDIAATGGGWSLRSVHRATNKRADSHTTINLEGTDQSLEIDALRELYIATNSLQSTSA